jgi:tetratricopeptide (TPR) repeat protein
MKYIFLVLAAYMLIRSLVSYFHFRRDQYTYKTVIEYLNRYPDNGIGWLLSMASALLRCQQYADSYRYLDHAKEEFQDFLEENPHILKEININMNFCKSPLSHSGDPQNRDASWIHYVLVHLFGKTRSNNISKQTMSKVASWVQAGKP